MARLTAETARGREPAGVTFAGHALGVAVESARDVPGLLGSGGYRPHRRLELLNIASPEPAPVAAPQEGERLVDHRYLDGRPMMHVDALPGGYRVHAPGYGLHLVDRGGLRVRSVASGRLGCRWQRLFYAQVLPLAAALQGLHVLHASAVVKGGRAVAFVAPSGTGKTSLALHLTGHGCGLLTDDVLAVASDDAQGAPTVHPGPRFSNVDSAEYDALRPEVRDSLGPIVGISDKIHVRVRLVEEPVELAAICFLRRGRRFVVERHERPPTRAILGASFLPHLRTPARLLTHLDASAELAASVASYDVELAPGMSAAESAAALAGGIGELA